MAEMRDQAELTELRAAINADGSLTEHRQFVELAQDGAAALEQLVQANDEVERLKQQIVSNGQFMRAQDEVIAALRKELAEAQQARERAEKRLEQLIIAVTGVILRDGRALVVKRAEHEKAFPGLWAFPGGKVEHGESAEAALAREIEEETGLRMRGCGTFLGIFKFTRSDLRPVVGVRFSVVADGDVRISEDFTEYRWVTPEELAELPRIPGIEQDFYLALKAEAERDTLIGLLREARDALESEDGELNDRVHGRIAAALKPYEVSHAENI